LIEIGVSTLDLPGQSILFFAHPGARQISARDPGRATAIGHESTAPPGWRYCNGNCLTERENFQRARAWLQRAQVPIAA